MYCLYCGDEVAPNRKYCNASHKQMAWARRHKREIYRYQHNRLRQRGKGLATLNRNLAFIVAAMTLENQQSVEAEIKNDILTI